MAPAFLLPLPSSTSWATDCTLGSHERLGVAYTSLSQGNGAGVELTLLFVLHVGTPK